MTDFADARRHMVDGQVRPADVTDLRVISAMLEVPRENFTSPSATSIAYLDLDLPVGEGAGDGGGPAGDLQQAIDVFQVGAHGCLGDAQAAGDLGVGVPGGDQVQQVPVPGGELRGRVAAALGVEVGLVQVRAQHGEQVAVAVGEIRAGPAEEDQP